MRLPIIPPAEWNAEQKPLAEDMKQGIAASFQGFVNIRDDGALLGPWNPWIHEPKFGKPVWELTKAMASNAARCQARFGKSRSSSPARTSSRPTNSMRMSSSPSIAA